MSDTKASPLSVLVVGESWIKHTVHQKGFDQFHTTEYEEGAGVFLGALADSGFKVTYIRAHEISSRFPKHKDSIDEFDVVVLSDVGSTRSCYARRPGCDPNALPIGFACWPSTSSVAVGWSWSAATCRSPGLTGGPDSG